MTTSLVVPVTDVVGSTPWARCTSSTSASARRCGACRGSGIVSPVSGSVPLCGADSWSIAASTIAAWAGASSIT
ncbi:MAG TPA: hypothetical protein VFL99_18175 [Segeticoccus sp.]|nr:hypothetical protein [Segeticoccus sp.]HET8602257.1 hypothetical protein [Segeticoccus sp.]